MRVLVTGATGYVGGRLVPELLDAGHTVRAVSRSPEKLDDRPWRGAVDAVEADVLDADSLDRALAGCDAAYYLVHSMGDADDFHERDRRAARSFQQAADRARLRQIVYLGGLGDEDDDLSRHLASRHEVGRILASGGTAVTELRAAVIIGSGSASFEMLRNLVEVLPAMVTPRWVQTRCQPIAIRDVVADLVEVLGRDDASDTVLEVGGPDVLTYEELMRVYAEEVGLPRRWIVRVPLLSPGLSSQWIGLVTPMPPGIARPLVDGLVNEVVVTRPNDVLAERRRLGVRRAIQLATRRVADLERPTPQPTTGEDGDGLAAPRPEDPPWSGGRMYDATTATSIAADRSAVDQAIERVVSRRLGTWEVVCRDHAVTRLRSTGRLPGTVWVELRPRDEGTDGTRLQVRGRFHPHGLTGRAAWIASRPVRDAVLTRLADEVAADAAGGVSP